MSQRRRFSRANFGIHSRELRAELNRSWLPPANRTSWIASELALPRRDRCQRRFANGSGERPNTHVRRCTRSDAAHRRTRDAAWRGAADDPHADRAPDGVALVWSYMGVPFALETKRVQ
jgi:hypothetical protein